MSEILFCSPHTIHSINVCDWINLACSVWVSRLWLIIAHVIPLMTDCLIDLSFRDRTQWVNQITHYLPPGKRDVFIFVLLWLFTFILHFANPGHRIKLDTFCQNIPKTFFTHKNRALKWWTPQGMGIVVRQDNNVWSSIAPEGMHTTRHVSSICILSPDRIFLNHSHKFLWQREPTEMFPSNMRHFKLSVH